jgi:hypothetical protein
MPLRDQWVSPGRGGSLRGARFAKPPPASGPSLGTLVAAAAVMLALLGGGGWLYYESVELHVVTDRETLCPVDRPVAGLTVILLDASDTFSEGQLLQIKNALARLRDELPRFTLLEMYSLGTGNERLVKPVFHLCQPGTGAGLNELYQNPRLAQERWEKGFKDRLDAEMEQQLHVPDAPVSPIYEAIQSTALRSFGDPAYDHVPKRLILISDLLQNVPGKQSHYRGVPSFEEFRNSPYFAAVRSNLDGVQVDLIYLNRSDLHIQGINHIQFWDQFFAAQGATVHGVDRIYGDR